MVNAMKGIKRMSPSTVCGDVKMAGFPLSSLKSFFWFQGSNKFSF